jgi:hypothetical protein
MNRLQQQLSNVWRGGSVPAKYCKCYLAFSINFTPGAKNISIHFPNVETRATIILKIQNTDGDACRNSVFLSSDRGKIIVTVVNFASFPAAWNN